MQELSACKGKSEGVESEKRGPGTGKEVKTDFGRLGKGGSGKFRSGGLDASFGRVDFVRIDFGGDFATCAGFVERDFVDFVRGVVASGVDSVGHEDSESFGCFAYSVHFVLLRSSGATFVVFVRVGID